MSTGANAYSTRGRSSGVRARLLAVNSLVVAASFATTTVVAALVGPPMFQRLMDGAAASAAPGEHPYQRAFANATAISVGTALGVSALVAMGLSWYISRRVHRSAVQLSRAAKSIADGQYEVRVPAPHLGREFDEFADDFNIMARQLGEVEHSRRQLLADLAHEIRTPVAVLEAYMEAFEDGVQTVDGDTLAVLREQTRRLTRFSADVGRLSTAERGGTVTDIGPIALDTLVTATIAAFEHRSRGIGVIVESSVPQGVSVSADGERLSQVLSNLLDNALRHTHRGDRIRVSASEEHGRSTIVVTDTGDGVPVEHLTRLFDRFYRVDAARDREHGGAGIGLAIAKAIMEAHGGRIVADSRGPGTGCTFTLTLPRSQSRTNGEPAVLL